MFTFSCEKENSKDIEYDCEAIVISKFNSGTIQCDRDVYYLKITKGEDQVKSLFEENEYTSTSNYYQAVNLPDELKEEGLNIKLDVRRPNTDESPSCHDFSMPLVSLPTLYVIRAEKK